MWIGKSDETVSLGLAVSLITNDSSFGEGGIFLECLAERGVRHIIAQIAYKQPLVC